MARAPALAALAILLASSLASVGLAHPSECTEYVSGFVRSCERLPSGQRGFYYDTPVLFVMAASSSEGLEAGAGSLAGATVASGGGRSSLAVYAHTVVAFDRVVVRAEPETAGLLRGDAWGVLVTVPVQHVGFAAEEETRSSVFAGDADGDGAPDARVVALGVPVGVLP